MKQNNLNKKSLIFIFGFLAWIVFFLTANAFQISTNITNAVAYLKKLVIMQNDWTTTGLVLDWSGWKIQANSFCNLNWNDCKTITEMWWDSEFLSQSGLFVRQTETWNRVSASNRVNSNSWKALYFYDHSGDYLTGWSLNWYLTWTWTNQKRCIFSGSSIICDQDAPSGWSSWIDKYLTGAEIWSDWLITFYVSWSTNPSLSLLTWTLSNSETLAPTVKALSWVNSKFWNLTTNTIPMRNEISRETYSFSDSSITKSWDNINIWLINISTNTTTWTISMTSSSNTSWKILEILWDSPTLGINLKWWDINITAWNGNGTGLGIGWIWWSVYINWGKDYNNMFVTYKNVILSNLWWNVGIWTTNPSQKLEVDWNVVITWTDKYLKFINSWVIQADNMPNQIFLWTNGRVAIWTGNTISKLTVDWGIYSTNNIKAEWYLRVWNNTKIECTWTTLWSMIFSGNIIQWCVCHSWMIWTWLYAQVNWNCDGGTYWKSQTVGDDGPQP